MDINKNKPVKRINLTITQAIYLSKNLKKLTKSKRIVTLDTQDLIIELAVNEH